MCGRKSTTICPVETSSHAYSFNPTAEAKWPVKTLSEEQAAAENILDHRRNPSTRNPPLINTLEEM